MAIARPTQPRMENPLTPISTSTTVLTDRLEITLQSLIQITALTPALRIINMPERIAEFSHNPVHRVSY